MFIVTARKASAGFSMIELLVTMLVFAVGLLGIASLQTQGMNVTRDAELMGKASILASSMVDRMRGNLDFTAGYVGIDGTDKTCLDADADVPEPSCTPEQEEMIQWNDTIQSMLPNG
ncbi:MAG: type IV pilus modification protein PilV, partial [Phototrophicales bacterium]